MKLFSSAVSLLFILFIGCGGEASDGPEQVAVRFFEAYENGDGHALISCMSSEALGDIESYIDLLKETPDESAEYLIDIGIEVTTEDVVNLTPGDFLNALFSSPVYAGELPDFSGVEFGETAIRGDRALVRFTIDGNMEEIELVQENGNWKIVGNGMEIL